MQFVYRILKTKIPELNERELSETDFEIISKRENISVALRDYPKPFVSAYFPRKKGSLIVLHSSLRGAYQNFYLWYELGRHFLHGARTLSGYWNWLRPEKDRFEAEALPLIAMMPQTKLTCLTKEYSLANSFYRYLIKRRFYLLDFWKI